VQDQLVRNGAGSRHPGKYEPSISTLGLSGGVGLALGWRNASTPAKQERILA
jgi:hypothetical protein